ncbi:formin-like protein 20 [Passer montanus]|uniref:formin-like protein 20 n=1 Tax=Passer montanus TaxID=9160 RepID=UPI0019617015|nr:formin-like protein 20 [Passer montanus]
MPGQGAEPPLPRRTAAGPPPPAPSPGSGAGTERERQEEEEERGGRDKLCQTSGGVRAAELGCRPAPPPPPARRRAPRPPRAAAATKLEQRTYPLSRGGGCAGSPPGSAGLPHTVPDLLPPVSDAPAAPAHGHHPHPRPHPHPRCPPSGRGGAVRRHGRRLKAAAPSPPRLLRPGTSSPSGAAAGTPLPRCPFPRSAAPARPSAESKHAGSCVSVSVSVSVSWHLPHGQPVSPHRIPRSRGRGRSLGCPPLRALRSAEDEVRSPWATAEHQTAPGRAGIQGELLAGTPEVQLLLAPAQGPVQKSQSRKEGQKRRWPATRMKPK